jgi:hypothetical protein
MPPRRPFGVTLLLWLVLMLAAWGAIRFFASLRWWEVLNEFDARLSPLYLSITGAGWGVAGIVLFWGVVNRKAWARTAMLITTLGWQVEFWAERAVFDSPNPNLLFASATSCLLIGVIVFITLHGSTRYYLTKSEEHEQPDEHSKTP